MRRIDHSAAARDAHSPPTRDSYQRHYWETAWDNYDEARMMRNLRREYVLPVARRVFPRGARLLEAGCGTGNYCIAPSREGSHAVGIGFALTGLTAYRAATPALPPVGWTMTDMPLARV